MKHLLSALALSVMLVATGALASPRDLNDKSFLELPVITPATIVSGDYVPVYDASTRLVKKVDALATTPRSAVDAVANGQTSKAVTVTGVTTSSRCVASLTNATTNAVYVRGVVPTANTVTVTLSGDPGASTGALAVICVY